MASGAGPRTIAALGSSFAAGPTIEPVADVDAMRSTRNYAHLLAEALRAELTDLTVSGATTANILDTPQQMMTGREFAPQIDGLPADVDLVTVTAGGNDLQFIGSMLYAAWARYEPGGPLAQMVGPGFADGLPAPGDDDIERTASGLAAVVAAVHARAPQARVVLVDYLTVITETTPTGDGEIFSPEELAIFLGIQTSLTRAYRIAAERSGAELLAASTASVAHGLGSQKPWVFGFKPDIATTAGSFHPNELGMSVIASQLSKLVE